MPTRSPNERLTDIAERQLGVFSRDQAIECGFTGRQIEYRVNNANWARLLPTVYALRGHPVTFAARVHAALLWAGDNAAASHRCAARLWGFPGMEDAKVEITFSGGRKMTSAFRIHSSHLFRDEIVQRGRLRLTSVARTLLDLAGQIPECTLEALVDHALLTRLATLKSIQKELDRSGRGRSGSAALRKLIDDRDPKARPSMSEMERIFTRLLKSSGLPAPVKQHPVRIGKDPAYIDFAYPQERLAIETDGYRWHGAKKRWEKDVMRSNELQAMGWRVVRITWAEMTEHPERVVSLIRHLLTA